MTLKSVALFVDGDNISADLAPVILNHAEKLGPLEVRRAYCNTGNLSKWSKNPSLSPVFAGKGKNGSDILMAIDAIEITMRRQFHAVVIATSDRDFLHLATRLREHGHYVLGLGEEKCPQTFRDACTNFRLLNRAKHLGQTSKTPAKQEQVSLTEEKVAQLTTEEIKSKVRQVLGEPKIRKEGISLPEFGKTMSSRHRVTKDHIPDSGWQKYLEKESNPGVIRNGRAYQD